MTSLNKVSTLTLSSARSDGDLEGEQSVADDTLQQAGPGGGEVADVDDAMSSQWPGTSSFQLLSFLQCAVTVVPSCFLLKIINVYNVYIDIDNVPEQC